MTGRDNRSGFTLLELLMVVIIIAILASIAMPQFFRVVERSRTSQMLPLLGTIRGSEIRYRALNNLYDNSAGLVNLDITQPAVMPTGWAAPTATGTAPGSNVQAARTSGTFSGATLQVNIDDGITCASTAAAATEWGVAPPGC